VTTVAIKRLTLTDAAAAERLADAEECDADGEVNTGAEDGGGVWFATFATTDEPTPSGLDEHTANPNTAASSATADRQPSSIIFPRSVYWLTLIVRVRLPERQRFGPMH